MNNYWNSTSTGYNPQWTTSTSFGKAYIIYTLKK